MPHSETFDRYLSILGIDNKKPSLGHLRRLVHAQLVRVPFENISKLFLKKTRNASFIPTLEDHCGFPTEIIREAIGGIALKADIYS